MKIIVASNNENKLREIRQILSPLNLEIVSQSEAGINLEVEETGETFAENALLKARAIAKLTDEFVLADDSGLCIDALGGKPGVYSARYAGENATDAEKITKVLTELGDETNRKAHFVTNIAFIFPNGREIVTEGKVEGEILYAPEGTNGFGYDPIFYSTELNKVFAKAEPNEKNSVSHRGRALRTLFELLEKEKG